MPSGIAILGGGIFAKEAHLPALKDVPEFTLKACWSRSSDSAESVKAKAEKLGFPSASSIDVYSDSPASPAGDLDALLARNDIHAVILSLPIPSQPDIIRRAWAAGKHVLSEKPVAKDLASAHELIQLWEKEFKPEGLHWIVLEQFPLEPAFDRAREIMASSDAIGELRSFSMEYILYVPEDGKYQKTAWRATPEYQGGYLLDGGVHFAAGLRWALGGHNDTKLTEVIATSSRIQPHLPPHDTLQGILRTSTGASGTFTISFAHEQTCPPLYIFRGSKALLSVTQVQTDNGRDYEVKLVASDGKTLIRDLFPSTGVAAEMKAFGAALDGKSWDSEEVRRCYAQSGPRATLQDLSFVEAALTSGQTGRWVALE